MRGRFARLLLEHRGWTELGFVRLGDYTRERLGLSPRILEEEARVARAFENLPQTFAAFLESGLSWTQVRLLTTVANPGSERSWIATAKGCDTRTLQEKVGHRSPPDGAARPADDDPAVRFSVRVSREGRLRWRAACEMAERTAGKPLAQAEVLELVVAEAASGAPLPHGVYPGGVYPGGVYPGGDDAGRDDGSGDDGSGDDATSDDASSDGASSDGASDSDATGDVAGGDDASGNDASGASASADTVAAGGDPTREASGAREAEARGEKVPEPDPAEHIHVRLARHLNDIAREENLPRILLPARGDSPRERLEAHFDRHDADSHDADRHDARDPFAVDSRLREIGAAMQRLDADLGRLLCRALERRLHRESGFRNFEDYVEARLDFCARKAWTLVAVERATARSCSELAAAYRDGRLTLLATARLLAVMDSRHGRAWIERASIVTLRRLEAEVRWALDRRDASTGAEAFDAPAPPPLDHDLRSDAPAVLDPDQLQMRAQGDPQVGGSLPVTMHFHVPSTVAGLAEDTMLALRRGSELRGAAFERMVATVLLEWTAAPKHRDPIFERDGWRCAVPGCGSRRNLQDHHIVFRSHGGDDSQANRVTLCAAHHLYLLHRGRIRARGTAPSQIVWELGCRRTTAEPLARLIGDRYVMRA